jgi:hypothetical protein
VCANEGPGSNGYTLGDYRDATAGIVSARVAAGDCQLHVVRGETLTTLVDLSDGAHLNVPGAARFAAALAGTLGAPWGDFDADGTWDVDDWVLLAGCLTGPDTPGTGACDGADRDCDGDVDLAEVAAFQVQWR